jgi:menaquinol-cytochrome c reductase iron-sulfur subunit
VAGGPPVRPLDRFYTFEHNGYVYIGPRYSVNSELQRFSPRDPGEPLDGIGRILYPPRFDTAALPPTNNLPGPPTIPGT